MDQEYRERAAHARRLAREVLDALMREQLEMAARDYDEMADQAEETSAKDFRGKLNRRTR